jgi:hypothetical protein
MSLTPGPRQQPRPALWRYLYQGRLRWAQPHWLLEETPEHVVSAIVPGVHTMAPKDFFHERYIPDLLAGAWELDAWVWHTRRILQVTPFDAAHSLGLHWDHASGDFLGWYVNLQEAVRRSPLGPHVYDTFDQMLDVWIEPDGSWRWKDWDELVEAERVGLFTSAEVAAIRAEGERVIAGLGTRLPTGWEDWRPDPSWALPTLPEGWDRP